jgi:aldose 1-epimerase
MITLIAGSSKADIVPQMGAGLAGLWAGERPVLRPWSGREEDGPFALGCNLLVPFSNRISGGRFSFDGQLHPVPTNVPRETYPLHGDGFQRPWETATIARDRAELHLPRGGIGPFRYDAAISYHLTSAYLETRLSVTNRGESELPFGLGLHPWFPRSGDTRVQFTATGHWPEAPDHLPATREPLPFDSGCPWQDLAPLPQGWINKGFSGWDGRAQIVQGPGATSLQMTSEGLGIAFLYSPSDAADFFCFEPVSHPVDAHNLPGQPGLVRLAPGETQTASMTLTWGPAA